jgi:DNA ligase D-like protein (predicted 3'-phosphoesterase)
MPLFVVQKHAASTLHYDFRLEIGGVLKSWVLPKGPSIDPHVKRMAIPTNDHALEFADFEGVIPEGQYGAGKVMIWDRGEFRNETYERNALLPLEQACEAGKITFVLEGEKLKGKFTLLRIKEQKNWLLIKHHDDDAKEGFDITKKLPNSVVSGRAIDEIG